MSGQLVEESETASGASAPDAGESGSRTGAGQVLTLASVLLGFLVVPMAMSGTSVALPRIAKDLDAGSGALQWVVTGYFLAASCLTLVAGSLGDIFGRRRVFRLGAIVYVGCTFAAAGVTDILLLDVARALSGVGSACVLAGGGAVLGSTFSGAARTRAFAAVGTTVGVGLAFGPTVAGWLVSAFGWREMFLVFAGIGVLVLLGTAFMRESRADVRPKVDVYGTIAFVIGMVALMYGINQAAEAGWGSVSVLGFLAVGLVVLAVFLQVERRSEFPVLDLELVRNRPFLGWLLAALTMSIGTVGVLVYLPTYLQGAGGLTAGESGMIMLAMTVPVLTVPPIAGKLVNMGIAPRTLIVTAMLLMAGGNAWLTVLQPGSGIGELIGPLVLLGAGNGMATALVDPQAMNLVGADRVGMASGLLNTVRGGANTLALALFGASLVSLIQTKVGERALAGRVAAGDLSGGPRADLAAHYTYAWHIVLWAVAAACVLAALTVHQLVRRRGRHRRTGAAPYGRHRRGGVPGGAAQGHTGAAAR
ncbi:MFS transporter [Streptomyces sp. NPDC054796]